MTDFQAWNATTHPIVRLEDDHNNWLDHAWWRGIGYHIRINGSYYEAINMQTGVISYGGVDNVGAVTGTDADAVINAALAGVSATGGVVDLGRQEFPIDAKIVFPNTVVAGEDRQVTLRGDQATLAGDAGLADHMIELDADAADVNYSARITGIQIYPAAKDDSYYSIYLKDPLVVWVDHCVVGWEGIKVEDCGYIYLHDLTVIDSYNEGIALDTVTYSFLHDIYLDNCGGYGVGAYNALSVLSCAKTQFDNIRIYGGKGVEGGQQNGIYIGTNSDNLDFSNISIEGCILSGLKITDLSNATFTNLSIWGTSEHGIELAPTANIEHLTFTNLDIDADATDYGIGGYAQNTFSIKHIAISNATIHDSAKGIYLNDDTSGGATCEYWTVDNVVFDTLTNGFEEGSNSNHNQVHNSTMDAVTTPVTLLGANSRARNVKGYRNEHAGVATMVNATATLDIDPAFHASIDFTATAPVVTLAGQHAEVLDIIWAVKDADEITVTSQAVTTDNRLFNYYIAMPEVFRL